MYATVENHLFNLLHYLAAVLILYFVFPRVIFKIWHEDLTSRFLAYSLRSVCCLIIMGYVLIILKLFEVPVLLTILMLVYLFNKNLLSLDTDKREKAFLKVVTLYFDLLDGIQSVKSYVLGRLIKFKSLIFRRKITYVSFIENVLLLLILVLSFYLRFYDVYFHAAPSMSDAYVTLSWMKNAQEQMLFVDGIYPQGFYILLDYFYKFSGIDPLYVLRYTGPVMNTLAVFCIYFFVTRVSNNRLAGIASALLMGVFGNLLCGEWDRQAATLSQEYGFILVVPTLYFYYQWVRSQNKLDFQTSLFGSCAVGLVHAIGFAFLWMGVGALILADLTLYPKDFFYKIKQVIKAFLLSTSVSITPAIIGWLEGKGFHENSFNFTFEEVIVNKPPINIIDLFALGAAFFLLCSSFIGSKERRLGERFVSLFGLVTYFVYEYLGWITKKELISSRSPDLWAITIPLLIGMAAAVIIKLLLTCRIPNKMIVTAAGLTVLLLTLFYPSAVIHPDKLESDSGLEQYLRISESFAPKSWMIIYSFREANNMIRGKGYHMYVGPKIGLIDAPNYFIFRYDPYKAPLTLYGDTKPDLNIPGDVFIFYEKKIFKNPALAQLETKAGKKAEYATREKDMLDLKQWLEEYRQAHGSLPIYYDGKDLTVYHFKRVDSNII